ncbi:lysophospholipid acyltransferase family protein [Bacillus sp. FJAT-27986]|uniref:lysophospholipid acyltransferase family protein n=1 Tax=Bacillus sp. FJAT-27986 TaxID=1743146 RepID=UPI000ACFB5F7|nr:lysophospholipid acyltransferase family protein [Bacillus sp. FJAT-27986]
MLRLVYMVIYLCGFLLYSLPGLSKMKKVYEKNNAHDDVEIQQIPKKWAKGFLKNSGCELEVVGSENIPDGPVLFVGNHEGDFDIPVLMAGISKPFGFISKIEVKKIPIVAGWMEVMGCVFMDRKDRRASIQAIREGVQKLKDGHSILIFPEGTRNRGKEIGEFKAGSLRLAKDTRVPIVPFMITGTADLFENNNNKIKPGKVKLVILPAITSEQYEEEGMTAVAEHIHTRIKEERSNLLKGA